MEKEILSYISELKKNISVVDLEKIDRSWKSYGRSREIHNLAIIRMHFKKVRHFLEENKEIRLLSALGKIEKNFEDGKIEIVLQDLDKLEKLSKSIKPESKKMDFNIKSNLPLEIRNEIEYDLRELERCFNYQCYKSSIILCSRILEIALHRKYYELTKEDLLENSIRINLSELISKLKENKINLDGALMNQSDFINQINDINISKKSVLLNPSREQANTVVFLTLDTLNKVFK